MRQTVAHARNRYQRKMRPKAAITLEPNGYQHVDRSLQLGLRRIAPPQQTGKPSANKWQTNCVDSQAFRLASRHGSVRQGSRK